MRQIDLIPLLWYDLVMSERFASPLDDQPEVARFSPITRLLLTKAEMEGDRSLGAPERHVREIYRVIVNYLENTGIDPESVLFSGYCEGSGVPEIDDTKDRINDELRSLSRKANQLYVQGYFDEHPDEKSAIQNRLAELKNDLKQPILNHPTYFFTGIENLDFGEPNPIDYAATTGSPAIGIYDRVKLEQMPGYEPAVTSVTAAPEEVESTKIAVVYPHYFDEDGNIAD